MSSRMTGVRYADRPTVEVDVHISASPGEVWSVVANPLLMPEMSEELQAVEWLDGASEAAVGARFRGHNRRPDLGEWSTTATIIACAPHRELAWAIEDVAHPAAVWRFSLTADESGTRLTQHAQIGPGRSGLNIAIDRMPDKEEKIVANRLRELERYLTRTLGDIKARVESAAAAAH